MGDRGERVARATGSGLEVRAMGARSTRCGMGKRQQRGRVAATMVDDMVEAVAAQTTVEATNMFGSRETLSTLRRSWGGCLG